jgi:hypothetical protein
MSPIEKSSGILLILFGVCLLLLGILLMSPISSLFQYSWISSISLFFGAILSVLGFLVYCDFYSTSSFIGRLGSIFVTVSLACFAGVLMSVTYTALVEMKTVAVVFRGVIVGYKMIPVQTYPLAWLFPIFLWSGIILFGAGMCLKIYSDYL